MLSPDVEPNVHRSEKVHFVFLFEWLWACFFNPEVVGVFPVAIGGVKTSLPRDLQFSISFFVFVFSSSKMEQQHHSFVSLF